MHHRVLIVSLLACCAWPIAAVSQRAPRNVLFVVLDDVGVDRIAAYGEHPDAGPTPTIDALAAGGVLFRNAYSQPVCSPTRLEIMSGRYAARDGLGVAIQYDGSGQGGAYVPSPPMLPAHLAAHGARPFLIGKWHLSNATLADPYMHPVAVGFEASAGPVANLSGEDGSTSYTNWNRVVATATGASAAMTTAYATTAEVDDALAAIAAAGSSRWLVVLSLNAPHKPLHIPAAHLQTVGQAVTMPASAKYRAMLQAADTELGRLLASIPASVMARTVVIVVGDNGTPEYATTAPWSPDHAKKSVYEGGINVPLIVAGPGVVAPGREVGALVQTVDLTATICDMLGVPPMPSAGDSLSLVPYLRDPSAASRRAFTYAQHSAPNGPGAWAWRERAARGERYKLIRRDGILPAEEFFDVLADPLETLPLPPSAAPVAYAEAAAFMESVGP